MRVHRFLALVLAALALNETLYPYFTMSVFAIGAALVAALLAVRAHETSSGRVAAIAAAFLLAAAVVPYPFILSLAGFAALTISVLLDVTVEPVHVEITQIVHAPPERVAALYQDWSRWPELFPATVRAVRFVSHESGATFLEVDHGTEGTVPNVIRVLRGREILLDERKPRYQAFFLNRFEPVPAGTRYTVVADVALRGPLRLLSFVAAPFVRKRVKRYVLEPMRHAAEASTPPHAHKPRAVA